MKRRRKRLCCRVRGDGRVSVMPVVSPVRGWHGLVSVVLSSVGSECGFCRNCQAQAASGACCFRVSRGHRAGDEARVREFRKENIVYSIYIYIYIYIDPTYR